MSMHYTYKTKGTCARVIDLDVHTGLPNKSRCEDLLNSSGFITEPLCFVMFDLNNLKEVNDTLGHAAGDSMIANLPTF